MATIKAIEGGSVHQIQSGQVIVDLCSVVKELVENSLDAGATSIEIRFKNQGLDSIEVQDNGKGIAPEDFETIALKHYTSKLSNYEDLTSLDTFGFRGEALSSLCALSKFHIVTARSEDGAVGKKLDFEVSGKLKGTSVSAAPRGTTVAVENLFCNLPVRRKELEKNIKREYGKVISYLYAYACISVGVRFAVSNTMPKAKKVSVFSTKSNTTTKENITNVFGAKTLIALVKLDLHLAMEPTKGPSTQGARNWSTQALDRSMEVLVQGHISKPVFGEGRQAPDRQMFFVNSRPCQLPQVAKAFNEVYKTFNVSQSPFIFANLIMDTNAYDVNVSPDKRTIMLHDQTALLDNLKASLTEMFEHTDHTVPQSQLSDRKLPSYKPLTVPRRISTQVRTRIAEHGSEEGSDSEEQPQTQTNDVDVRRNGSANGAVPSLIQNWAERDAEERSDAKAPSSKAAPLSKDNSKLARSLEQISALEGDNCVAPNEAAESAISEGDGNISAWLGVEHNEPIRELEVSKGPNRSAAKDHELDPLSTTYGDLFSHKPPQVSKRVQDFNDLMDGRQARDDEPDDAARHLSPGAPEPEIPSVGPSSQKSTPGPVQNAFDRMRPQRTPMQTAEITVGDQTTTTVIGSTPSTYKRRRIHQPANSQTIARFGGSPLLARGLSRFAAPGTQVNVDSNCRPERDEQEPESSDEESPNASDEEEESVDDPREDAEEKNVGDMDEKMDVDTDESPSQTLDELVPAPTKDDESDADYVDEEEKRIREDEKVARLIQEAEMSAAQPTENNLKRASQALKNDGSRKASTLQLTKYLHTSVQEIDQQIADINAGLAASAGNYDDPSASNTLVKDEIDDNAAESRLSLTVSKADFERMQVIGQFNLGFILAVRPASKDGDEDELFIIDQHAADEKFNYERLRRTITLQAQRLARPKPLDLTAIEEEIIINHATALKANGFEIEPAPTSDDDESSTNPDPAPRQSRLLTLPLTGEKTFDLSDLEELLHLLSEHSAGSMEIPRPKKVQSLLAMRACRSSIMVGKTLTTAQMTKVVRHMGEMEKPWNCPHGRPTMRHLAGLGSWSGWNEGDGWEDQEGKGEGRRTDWKGWLEGRT